MTNTGAITELEKKRDEFLSNAKALEVAISILRGTTPATQPSGQRGVPDVAYVSPVTNEVVAVGADMPNLKGTGVTARAIAIIKHVGRFISRSEIEDWAARYGYPFKGAIASTLSSDKSKDSCELTMVKVGGTGNGNSVWGLKSWVAADGQIAAGREPKDSSNN